jgi:hypothetical protein
LEVLQINESYSHVQKGVYQPENVVPVVQHLQVLFFVALESYLIEVKRVIGRKVKNQAYVRHCFPENHSLRTGFVVQQSFSYP